MDRDDLRSMAAFRKNNDTSSYLGEKVKWPCDFCQRAFSTETGFMNHFCKEKVKMDKLKSVTGQAAYSYYCEWLRLQKRSKVPQESFINSRMFNAFIKFAEWVIKIGLAQPDTFIKLMVDSGTVPLLWCRGSTYEIYLKYLDTIVTPEEQFLKTLSYLEELCIDHQCDMSEIFNKIGVHFIVQALKKRKMSAWLLLSSSVFINYLKSLSDAEKNDINEVINIARFIKAMAEDTERKTIFNKTCQEVNL